ncbi:hypothetical protein MAR_033084 [Mya arenaria]|uniref:Uncharacterized protein n=1 Tax=Mya arenaria TaxID=6604 RepID=A0ABY7G9F7_MYAAR|nr:hypothetical protein MAR_033084 [Mya arenaria]
MERRYYYQKRDASRTQQESYLALIIDGMDQAKTSLPHFAGRQSKIILTPNLRQYKYKPEDVIYKKKKVSY